MNVLQMSNVGLQGASESRANSGMVHAGADRTGQAVQASTNPPRVDAQEAAKAAEELNKRLTDTSTKVVLDPNAPLNHMWLNLVDSNTGEVIEKLPPEGIRQFIETQSTKGLTIDTKL